VSKKTKKPIKLRKSEKKNNQKNRTMKKKQLEFFKNQPVRFVFGFISLKLKKPNRTELNPNKKNRVKPKPVGLNRFWFLKKTGLVILLYEN
jgi:hypothetical protein